MQTEEQLLNEAFGLSKWNGYNLGYCELCEAFYISCEKCKRGTCGGWDENCSCNEDMENFWKNGKNPIEYLTQEEKDVIFKFRQLKKFSRSCFSVGKLEIDWKYLTEKGETCDNDSKIFPETNNYEYKPKYE